MRFPCRSRQKLINLMCSEHRWTSDVISLRVSHFAGLVWNSSVLSNVLPSDTQFSIEYSHVSRWCLANFVVRERTEVKSSFFKNDAYFNSAVVFGSYILMLCRVCSQSCSWFWFSIWFFYLGAYVSFAMRSEHRAALQNSASKRTQEKHNK